MNQNKTIAECTLGVEGVPQRLIAALSLGLGGDAIAVADNLYRDMQSASGGQPVSVQALAQVIAPRRAAGVDSLTFPPVYSSSNHTYLLRYWLAAGGIDPRPRHSPRGGAAAAYGAAATLGQHLWLLHRRAVEHATGRNTRAIVGGETCHHRMQFADGGRLETDLIVFSVGIQPRDALARACGLEVGERGGIVVDEQCRTSDPDICAIGECALWGGRIYGLLAPG